ncbi:MAG: amidohydrolase [Bacteroidetes bacterium]|nr:amidohydrolase [Bacteroidota bacterium]
MKADLILINGKVCTVDQKFNYAEAFAVKNGMFAAIGSTDQILKHYNSDSVVDAKGNFVYPGFIDAHCHFFGYALSLREINLTGIRSFKEITGLLLIQQDRYPGEWIVGRGWDQNLWDKKEFPDRTELDILFPERPVVLIRIDGHALLANGEALKRAGIHEQNKFSPGEVEMKNGRMTGILSENAADRMRNTIPLPSKKEQVTLLKWAQSNCFAAGLTGVADAGLDFPVVTFMDSLQQQGTLKMRLYVMLNPNEENIQNFIQEGQVISPMLTIRSIKIYADGSLGSRTALLKSPYSDDPLKTGIQVTSAERIREICELAAKYGYQVNTHAIGDSAVAMVLGIYAEFLKGKNDLRWRIEHAQVVDPWDIYRFGKFSIIPSVQATHATSDMKWAPDRLGKSRIKWAYAYKNLLDQNGWLPNGTDFPIEKISPLLSFYAAVARQDLSGFPEKGFQPENALSREEALRSVTIWAARAGFQEHLTGSIDNGKMADFVIVDRDLMTCPVKEIPLAKVIMTVVGGEKVYKNEK